VAAVIALSAFWTPLARAKRGGRVAVQVSLGLAALLVAGALTSTAFRLPGRKDPLRRVRGHANLARQVAEARAATNADFLIGNHYARASLLTFYLPGRPFVHVPRVAEARNQHAFWPGYGRDRIGQTALYVTKDPRVPPELAAQFEAVELVRHTQSTWRGKPVRPFSLFLLRRYRGADDDPAAEPAPEEDAS
jgi:hypothetical protein